MTTANTFLKGPLETLGLPAGALLSSPAAFGVRRASRLDLASRRMRLQAVRASTGITAKPDEVTLTGILIPFSRLSDPDQNGTRDLFRPNCFSRHLQSEPDILMLFNFNFGCVLGRTKVGTAVFEEQHEGLTFEAVLPDCIWSTDLAVSVSRDDVSGCACACLPTKFHYERTDDARLRVVEEARLLIASVVSWSPLDLGLQIQQRRRRT